MGASASQCVTNGAEELTFTNGHAALEATGCTSMPRCDIAEECLPEKPVGLSDKECADVLLVQAVTRADIADIQRALREGASVDTNAELSINMGEVTAKRIREVTPLMRACALGHEDVVMWLIQLRANPWRTDSHGWTPLCYALGGGEFELARKLLSECKSNGERQKAVVQKLQKHVIEQCEDSAGREKAEELRRELQPGGFLAKDLRRV
mmetsp:Transcript_133798/g.286149  ORF Transcript_133798/g.286149 Transcript_133798/m.286149 type:complete len:210 (+) Transcript_133798:104-733(+)